MDKALFIALGLFAVLMLLVWLGLNAAFEMGRDSVVVRCG